MTIRESQTLIERLHGHLAALEARVSRAPAWVTGVQGARIMRLIALMSGTTLVSPTLTSRPPPTEGTSEGAVDYVHRQLVLLERSITSEPAHITGMQGIRIMRLIALMSDIRVAWTSCGARLVMPDPYAHREVATDAPITSVIQPVRWKIWVVVAVLLSCGAGVGMTVVIQKITAGKHMAPLPGASVPQQTLSLVQQTPWLLAISHPRTSLLLRPVESPVPVTHRATMHAVLPRVNGHPANRAHLSGGRAMRHVTVRALGGGEVSTEPLYQLVRADDAEVIARVPLAVRSAAPSDWYAHLSQHRVMDVPAQFSH
ncbi:hypothetical protein [Burkholderia cepacia]|uniref:hypothetical protein n=1 Tax=Burkholderia cepacia TaxID=292 RepID=UPI00158EF300|nr:hypothetical protein [Burkholderia cepacia]